MKPVTAHPEIKRDIPIYELRIDLGRASWEQKKSICIMPHVPIVLPPHCLRFQDHCILHTTTTWSFPA